MRVVALAGGTGGAKLADGLQAVLPPGDLTVVVNTGDDTERHGLLVMPDHDAVLYMLAGPFDDERGWGQRDETWTVMDGLAEYGEEDWFRLGDRDFATHIARTARIREGRTLTEVGAVAPGSARDPDAGSCRWPTSPVRTEVRTDEGWLEFQEYFVHRRQAPEVREVRFTRRSNRPTDGRSSRRIEAAEVDRHRAVEPDRLDRADPRRADPGRSVDGTRRVAGVPVVAVSPIVGGVALKGPADRMLDVARPRIRAPGEWPGCTATSPRAFVLDTRRRRPRARDRRARAPDPRHRHGHGRRRRPRPARRGPSSTSPAPAMIRIAAIIPVGTLEGAKTRLGERLDAEERAGSRRGSAGTDRAGRHWPSTGSTTSWSSAPTATSCAEPPSSARGPSASAQAASTPASPRHGPTWSRAARTRSSSCRSTCRS